MSSKTEAVLVAYVPTPHAGYLKLFQAYAGRVLYVLGNEFIQEFQPLVRHLPAATPVENRKMIKALGIFSDVRIFDQEALFLVAGESDIVMPDEDVSRAFAERYFKGLQVTFDDRWRLRWDWGKTTNAHRRPEGERVVSIEEFDREIMQTAFNAGKRSPDWWRQIGAVLVKDGEVLLVAHNRHMPHEQSLYIEGDPRSNFGPGEHIELSGALHAEAGISAAAMRRGIKTEGCDLYVTTFPCPGCANTWAESGIRRLFYADGYSLVSGADTLQNMGVEIVRVEMPQNLPPS